MEVIEPVDFDRRRLLAGEEQRPRGEAVCVEALFGAELPQTESPQGSNGAL